MAVWKLMSLLTLHRISPASVLCVGLMDNTRFPWWKLNLSPGTTALPSFNHILLVTRPSASQVRLTEVLPSIKCSVGQSMEAVDIFAAQKKKKWNKVLTKKAWYRNSFLENVCFKNQHNWPYFVSFNGVRYIDHITYFAPAAWQFLGSVQLRTGWSAVRILRCLSP